MNILVCIKQVPDTNEVKIDSETNNLVRDGVPSIMNPYDEVGVELALQLRERYDGKVIVLSMGPAQAEEALKYALDMGADEAYLLSDRALGGSDTLATGYILSEFIRRFSYDLIICGAEAIDGCTGQVGPIIAENLDIPQFTYVNAVSKEENLWNITKSVGKYLEYCQTDKTPLLCVMKNIAQPRRAEPCDKEPVILSMKDISGIDMDRIGTTGSPTRVVKIDMSDVRQKCYVAIDDSLPAKERIRMIINGGIEPKERAELIRGSAQALAEKIVALPIVQKYR